jgi:hypothetical protein
MIAATIVSIVVVDAIFAAAAILSLGLPEASNMAPASSTRHSNGGSEVLFPAGTEGFELLTPSTRRRLRLWFRMAQCRPMPG